MSNPQDLIDRLSEYPLVQRCFREYIQWLYANASESLDNYDLVVVIKNNGAARLKLLEKQLNRSQELQGLKAGEFARKFFTKDLLVTDPQKVHDVLAEPLFVLSLDAHGFSEITKLPNALKVSGARIPIADFTAVRAEIRFAIEIKTVRTENQVKDKKKDKEEKPLPLALQPNRWGEMFLSNARTKIEDKKRRVVTQLENTCQHFDCQAKILVLYTRRLGVSALTEPDEYREYLQVLRDEYPVFDHICCKNYFGDVVLFEPGL